MSLEFQREIRAIDGRPYIVHIKLQENLHGDYHKIYYVERRKASSDENARWSIYIKDGDNEAFVIMRLSSVNKYLDITAHGESDKELAALKSPIIYQYKTGEGFEGNHKYNVVLTNHKAILDLPAVLEFENFVYEQVAINLMGNDSAIELE